MPLDALAHRIAGMDGEQVHSKQVHAIVKPPQDWLDFVETGDVMLGDVNRRTSPNRLSRAFQRFYLHPLDIELEHIKPLEVKAIDGNNLDFLQWARSILETNPAKVGLSAWVNALDWQHAFDLAQGQRKRLSVETISDTEIAAQRPVGPLVRLKRQDRAPTCHHAGDMYGIDANVSATIDHH